MSTVHLLGLNQVAALGIRLVSGDEHALFNLFPNRVRDQVFYSEILSPDNYLISGSVFTWVYRKHASALPSLPDGARPIRHALEGEIATRPEFRLL